VEDAGDDGAPAGRPEAAAMIGKRWFWAATALLLAAMARRR